MFHFRMNSDDAPIHLVLILTRIHRKQHSLEQCGHRRASRNFSMQIKHRKTSAKLWKKQTKTAIVRYMHSIPAVHFQNEDCWKQKCCHKSICPSFGRQERQMQDVPDKSFKQSRHRRMWLTWHNVKLTSSLSLYRRKELKVTFIVEIQSDVLQSALFEFTQWNLQNLVAFPANYWHLPSHKSFTRKRTTWENESSIQQLIWLIPQQYFAQAKPRNLFWHPHLRSPKIGDCRGWCIDWQFKHCQSH